MQIKRFEAADMTEALRMVKREFGCDAVILSAKEVRSRRFFSALRKKSVEITAAMDYPKDDAAGPSEFSGLLAQQVDIEAKTDHVSLSASSRTVEPMVQKAPEPPHIIFSPHRNSAQTEKLRLSLEQQMIAQSVTPTVAKRISRDAGECLARRETPDKALIQALEKQNMVANPFYRPMENRKVVALVGPSGVGKTTTVAKLARYCAVEEKKRVGLVSIDRFRLGANGLLQRMARILNLPVMIIHDADQLPSALDELEAMDVVLVDTPGVDRIDDPIFGEVETLLRQVEPDEVHLVVNVALRDDILANVVDTFLPLGVDRLLLTHMNECVNGGAVLNLLSQSGLPASFHCDGVDLLDHLHETTVSSLAIFFTSPETSVRSRVAIFPKKEQVPSGPMSVVDTDETGPLRYLANRNSELFHHPDCKSVKRINAKNITAFITIEQAMEKGFKPCRACCDINTVRKSTAVPVGHQHASAL